MDEVGRVRGREHRIYVEPNEVGGHRYWTDSIGGGAVIWDTSIASIEEIELAVACEKMRINEDKERRGNDPR